MKRKDLSLMWMLLKWSKQLQWNDFVSSSFLYIWPKRIPSFAIAWEPVGTALWSQHFVPALWAKRTFLPRPLSVGDESSGDIVCKKSKLGHPSGLSVLHPGRGRTGLRNLYPL